MNEDSSAIQKAGIVGIALFVAVSMIAGIGAGVTVTDDSPKIDEHGTNGTDDDNTVGDSDENTTADNAIENVEVTSEDVEEVMGEDEETMAMMEEMGMTFQDVADVINEMLDEIMTTSGSSV